MSGCLWALIATILAERTSLVCPQAERDGLAARLQASEAAAERTRREADQAAAAAEAGARAREAAAAAAHADELARVRADGGRERGDLEARLRTQACVPF